MSAIGNVRPSRAQAWQLLDSPPIWEALRLSLDAVFGLYRKRISTLRRSAVLEEAPSVLDVGCGTGRYCTITAGSYLGLDLTERYIARAQHRWRHDGRREFRSEDVTNLGERQTFDIVLMVDFLHHLDGRQCEGLLATAAHLARRHVISLEPVFEQHNRIGRWIIDHDRGDHMRSLVAYHALFERSPLIIDRSEELHLGPINTRALLTSVPHDRKPNSATPSAREKTA